MLSNYLWAKKCENNGKFFWLPLSQHLKDTKGVSGLLWEHWIGDGLKKLIDDSLDSNSKGMGKNLVEFLGAIHDICKATPVFQIKKGFKNSKDLDCILLERLERVGFNGISTEVFSSSEKTHHALGGNVLLKSFGVGDDICSIIGGHHGKPIDDFEVIETNLSAYKKNYFQSEDYNSKTYKLWENSQLEIFNWAMKICGFNSIEELPKVKQPAQVILTGILIMADWIASNENYFKLFDIEDLGININQQERLEKGFNRWRKNLIWEPDFNNNIEEIYNTRFNFTPNEVQKKFAEIIEDIDKPGIFILEAPMGIGKTECSLVVSELLAQKTNRNGIFFGLPTQATSDGVFARIYNWLEKLNDENKSLRLSHGKSQLNEIFNSFASNVNIDEREGTVFTNQWFSGKKASSLDDFVVGTVDNFLMIALKQKHLALRHLGFSKKVVIIDEVHAYDSYMDQYILKAINWMGAYGVPVIILSATLPEMKRLDLIKSYLNGKGVNLRDKRRILENDLKTDVYPLITYTDGDEILQYKNFSKSENKQYNIIKIDYLDLNNVVENSIKDGGIIGIVVNTVKKSQELAEYFSNYFDKIEVELLHSRFIDTHRKVKEQNLLNTIGKCGNRPFKKIIIGTQVIEQSLDIDFDVMISELAPMDLLIQRMGRLHRHNRNRPNNLSTPRFYVMGTSDDLEFDEGSSNVYGNYLLTRTQYYLKDVISIPEDISVLVQKVYSFDEDEIIFNEELNKKYIESKNKYFSLIENKKSKAKNYILDSPVLKDKRDNSLIGWLKNPSPNESEEFGYAQVRDLIDTIEVIAVKKFADGYAFFEEETEDISNKLDDFNICKKLATNTFKLPSIFSYKIDTTIRYLEEYNLKHLRNWQYSSWLKGSLGIIFDENNEFVIENHKIKYDKKYGLKVERM